MGDWRDWLIAAFVVAGFLFPYWRVPHRWRDVWHLSRWKGFGR